MPASYVQNHVQRNRSLRRCSSTQVLRRLLYLLACFFGASIRSVPGPCSIQWKAHASTFCRHGNSLGAFIGGSSLSRRICESLSATPQNGPATRVAGRNERQTNGPGSPFGRSWRSYRNRSTILKKSRLSNEDRFVPRIRAPAETSNHNQNTDQQSPERK